MANPIVWADVTAIAPELSALVVGSQTAILAYVNVAFNENMFKMDQNSTVSTPLKMARVYLAAHLGTLTRWQGSVAAGPLIAESDGKLSRQFATIPSSLNATFSGTSYGEMLQWILNTSKARYGAVLS